MASRRRGAAPKYLDNFDRQEAIDASRTDPNAPVVGSIRLSTEAPVTSNMLRYPAQLVVRIYKGQLPSWFAVQMVRLRRIQHRADPDYGFVTPSYTALGHDAYVCRSPGDSSYVREAIIAAAVKAGWRVDAWGSAPLNTVELYRPKDQAQDQETP